MPCKIAATNRPTETSPNEPESHEAMPKVAVECRTDSDCGCNAPAAPAPKPAEHTKSACCSCCA